MANKADGSIRISTELDSKKAMKQLQQFEKKLNRQTEAVNKQVAVVENLKRKYEQLTSTGGDIKLVTALERQLKPVEKELTAAIQQSDKLAERYAILSEFNVGEEETDEMRELAAQMDAVNIRTDELYQRAQKLRTELSEAKTNPETTLEAQKLQAQIDVATQKLTRLKKEASDTENTFVRTSDISVRKTEELSKGIKKVQNAFDNTKKSSKSIDLISGKLDALKKRVTAIAMTAFVYSLVRNSFNAMSEYFLNALKTNEAYCESLAEIKANLLTAFQPIYEYVLPGLNRLLNALSAFTAHMAAFTNALFGKSLADSQKAAKALYDEANALDRVNSSSKKASKSLASFDEVNILQDTSEEKEDTSETDFGGFEEYNFTWIDSVKEKLNEIWDHPIMLWLRKKAKSAIDFINEQIQKVKDKLQEWLPTLQSIYGKITILFAKAAAFLEPIISAVLPLIESVLSSVIDVFLGLAGAVIYCYDKFLSFVLAIGNFLESIGYIQLVQDQLLNVIEFVKNLFSSFTSWISGKIEAIKLIFGGICDFLTGIFSGDLETALGGLRSIIEGFKLSFETDGNFVKNIFQSVFDFFRNTVTNAKEFFLTFWDAVKNWFTELPGKLGYFLGSLFSKLLNWVSETKEWISVAVPEMINNIVTFFQDLPRKIKDQFNQVIDFMNQLPGKALALGENLLTSIWNGIKSGANWFWDRLKDFFGGFLDGFIDQLKPATVSSSRIVNIPHLATGAVIPPNQKFLAMLGDQTSGRNLEAPESLIRQIVREETAGAYGDMPREVVLELNGRELARATLPYLDKERVRVSVFAK